MSRRSSFRRPGLQNLERRYLLTTIAPDLLYAPIGEQFTVRRDEAEPVQLNVYLGIDHWQSGDRLISDDTPIETIDAEHGFAEIAPDGGSILYQPDPGFVGIDIVTISYVLPTNTNEIDDGEPAAILPAETRQLAVNVIEPLLAIDDWFQVEVGAEASSLDVLANDVRNGRYIGAEPILKLQSYRADHGGEISIASDQTMLQYKPAAGFTGVETIIYTAVDQDGYTVEGTTQVRVDNTRRDTLWPEQLQQQLIQAAVDRNQYSFGTGAYLGHAGWYRFDVEFGVTFANDVVAEVPLTDASGTNNQIAGIDESDRVKTDGEYLYVLSSPDQNQWHGWDVFPWIGLPERFETIPEPSGENLLTVIDVRQPDSPRIVSRQLFQDRVVALDLNADRLTVLSQRGGQTVVTALDVADPDDVNQVWTTVVDGQFKQTRRVGGTLYVFTDQYGSNLPPLETFCSEDERFCFYETGQQYIDRNADSLLTAVFPSQEVYDGAGDIVPEAPSLLIDPLEVGLSDYHGWLNVITFDTDRDVGGAIDWDLSAAGEHVLVTSESIYVTRTDHHSAHRFADDLPIFVDIPEQPTISTAIERFQIQADGTIDTVASAAVPGVLNNSFSIDEYNGLLRIATENSWWSVSPENDGTNIYVLEQTDETFDVIGGVTGLAPGEQIYAVRFAADRGYVVTFRRVDPLFVVDLSEPTSPQVLGELKTPGYSQYLHIVDNDHLIGIGRDADEETGLYQGLIISLFNVSDPANPVVQDRYEFEGGRTTFSPFAEDNPWDLRDHHAISYFYQSGILALPIYSKQNHWAQEDDPIFASADQSEVRTFHIDTAGGIDPLDSIPFDSRADRTVRVGEHLYSLSNDELKVTHLQQPDGIVAALQFERKGEDDFIDAEVGHAVTIDVTSNDGDGNDIKILSAALIDGQGEVEVDGNQLRFTPTSSSLAEQRIRYTAQDAAGTLIDAVATVDPDLQWQNETASLDVNNDGQQTARDALNIINWIARYGAVDSEQIERQIGDADSIELFYFDTTGDGKLSALDALLVINGLTDNGSVGVSAPTTAQPNRGDANALANLDDPGIQPEGEPLLPLQVPVTSRAKATDIVFSQSDDDNREQVTEPEAEYPLDWLLV